jgi:hypothetical protein
MPALFRLTILPYLQAWNGNTRTLQLNVVLYPIGDPRNSLTAGLGVAGPAIADASITLRANLSRSVSQLPMATAVDTTIDLPLVMPDNRIEVFDGLDAALQPTLAELPSTWSSTTTISKYLTRSYREAFAFTQPRTSRALIDDSFRCMLNCPPPVMPLPHPPAERTWAEVFAIALRVPPIMRRAGLLHTVEVVLPDSTFYSSGGWLFFTLAPDSDYADAAGSPGFVRSYATRIPALDALHARPVFTAVLFPVFADPFAASAQSAKYDTVFPEAITFDDGFAKIVHSTQLRGMEHLDEDGSGPPPVLDLGVQFGWDDEDVLIGQNRQMSLEPDGSDPADAPRGVNGYRVDVRRQGETNWTSLSAVHTDHLRAGPFDAGVFDGELRTEVHPRRIYDRWWLPAYFASWTGGSMVVDTSDDKALRGHPAPTEPLFQPAGLETPLRYGERYEFRVRMVDGSGGGPGLGEAPASEGEAPIAAMHFRRFLPPKKLRLIDQTTNENGTTIVLERPRIDYPAAVFAGIPDAVPRLRAIYDANQVSGEIPQDMALPDPDAAFAEIRVMVRPPAFDREGSTGGWREIYTTWRPFDEDPAAQLVITGTFVDVAQLTDLDLSGQTGSMGSQTGPLLLPTARDIRLELRAAGRNDLTYFANDRARRSAPLLIDLFGIASSEADFFVDLDPPTTLRSVFLRHDPVAQDAAPSSIQAQNDPAPVLVARLAAAAGLVVAEKSLVGRPGERVVFSCNGLKHRVSPDGGTLTLTHISELANLWINVLRIEINRDWTWKGAASPAFTLLRRLQHVPVGAVRIEDLNTLELPHSVSTTAVRNGPQRERTVLVFLDAFPAPQWNGLPYQLSLRYTVRAHLRNQEAPSRITETMLPVAAPPRQLPQLVSAGYALSPYATDQQYSGTAPRKRMLWFEMAQPLENPRDAYFVRVLAHSPDPLLLARSEPAADPPAEAKSPLDPEWARVIVPGQADDFAGLATMQRMMPAEGSDRHFLVPLPPGTSAGSPELFGFYSYEIRVGHDAGTPESPFWSTAQGRFGPTLIIEGVQHPVPAFFCIGSRVEDGILASAPYAQPFYNGANVLPAPPNTEIWVALYVQVHQADKATMRNVQLDIRRAAPNPNPDPTFSGRRPELMAETRWTNLVLRDLLAQFGLSPKTPLSVIAIELLPEPNGGFNDPLGGDLGEVRILRTSPLSPVKTVCC